MARGRGAKQYFTFVKGWNTEAAPTTFPENTAQDIDNVILDTDGSIRRRPGIDFEGRYEKYGLDFSDDARQNHALGLYEWQNVGGSGSLTFLVSQQGLTLKFHRQNGDFTSGTSIGTVDLTPFAINELAAKEQPVRVAAGQGVLFVCGRYIDPFYITYDGTQLLTEQVTIQIRDFEGDPEEVLDTQTRPSTLGDVHLYSLLNQGWDTNRIYAMATGGSSVAGSGTSRASLLATSGSFPSNADIVYLGMTTNNDGDPIFKASELKGNTFGNSPAATGHFILDAFSQDRNAATGSVGVVGATNVIVSARPESVAFHNGRVFWAGVFAQGLTGNVYYSQQLTDIDKAGRCYQVNDPTADQFNELLATDGGLVPIPNAGQILALAESSSGVIVFASNGVWLIGGSQGKFSATDLAVSKVTDIGCCGGDTVVEADGTFLYWSDSGIIGLTQDEISGELNAQNISKNVIQTGYLLIGGIQRRFARGAYITEEKKAVWLYSTTNGYNGTTNRWQCNGILVLDTQLGAYYKYSISDGAIEGNPPYVVDIVKTIPYTTGETQENVTVGGALVTVSAEVVTVGSDSSYIGSDISAWKLLTVVDSDITDGNYDLTMSEFYSRSFRDWFKLDGVGTNYSSFIETGYELQGNVMQDKQPTYVFSYFSTQSKSLRSGSYYELPSLIQYTSGFRVSQEATETLINGDSDMRSTQVAVETLLSHSGDLRMSQVAVETLITS